MFVDGAPALEPGAVGCTQWLARWPVARKMRRYIHRCSPSNSKDATMKMITLNQRTGLLFNRNYRLLWLGQTISPLGDFFLISGLVAGIYCTRTLAAVSTRQKEGAISPDREAIATNA